MASDDDRRRQLNFFLPTEIVEAFEKMSGPKKGKQKWLFGSAAILLLLSESDDTINALKGAVGSAAATDSFKQLIDDLQKNRRKGKGLYGLLGGIGNTKRN